MKEKYTWWLMIMLLVKINGIICTENVNVTKFLIDTVDKAPDDISLKSCCKINNMFYQRWWQDLSTDSSTKSIIFVK